MRLVITLWGTEDRNSLRIEFLHFKINECLYFTYDNHTGLSKEWNTYSLVKIKWCVSVQLNEAQSRYVGLHLLLWCLTNHCKRHTAISLTHPGEVTSLPWNKEKIHSQFTQWMVQKLKYLTSRTASGPKYVIHYWGSEISCGMLAVISHRFVRTSERRCYIWSVSRLSTTWVNWGKSLFSKNLWSTVKVLTGRLTDKLIRCVTQELPFWVADWLTDWLIDLLTHSELRSGVLRKVVQQYVTLLVLIYYYYY